MRVSRKKTEVHRIWPGLGLQTTYCRASFAATVLIVCAMHWSCGTCCDCFVPAMLVSSENEDGSEMMLDEPALLRLERIDEDGTSLGFLPRDVDLNQGDSSAGVSAGRYRVHVTVGGRPAINSPEVCTRGKITGCEADEIEESELPKLVVRKVGEELCSRWHRTAPAHKNYRKRLPSVSAGQKRGHPAAAT